MSEFQADKENIQLGFSFLTLKMDENTLAETDKYVISWS